MMPSEPHSGTHYSELLSTLCKIREVEVYFEIGVQSGLNLSKIEVDTAFGVDPGFMLSHDVTVRKKMMHLYRMTSDAFFRSEASAVLRNLKIDLAFLDGMHVFEYLLRDFYNTESLCKSSAVITMHDCLPFDGEMIERSNNPSGRTPGPYSGAWTGDVWKLIPILRKFRPDLEILALDCYPTGLIALTNLDSSSMVLRDNYIDIVKEYSKVPNDRNSVERLYEDLQLVPASSVIKEFDHSLYFKC